MVKSVTEKAPTPLAYYKSSKLGWRTYLESYHNLFWKTTSNTRPFPLADPGFSWGGDANSQVGAILQIFFAEKRMKIKRFGLHLRRVPGAPWIRQWFQLCNPWCRLREIAMYLKQTQNWNLKLQTYISCSVSQLLTSVFCTFLFCKLGAMLDLKIKNIFWRNKMAQTVSA